MRSYGGEDVDLSKRSMLLFRLCRAPNGADDYSQYVLVRAPVNSTTTTTTVVVVLLILSYDIILYYDYEYRAKYYYGRTVFCFVVLYYFEVG